MLQITDQNFVPVTDDRGVFIGIITRRDILRHFNEKFAAAKTKEKE
jgi:CBS domain-containing protein